MSSYISSNDNRWYCQREAAYGQVSAITAQNRFPAVKMTAKQQLELGERRDKNGGRTFVGNPTGGRRKTTFDVKTYMTALQGAGAAPAYGPLFEAAMGAAAQIFRGGTASGTSTSTAIGFTSPHGLTVQQAIECNGELRFVVAVIDASTVLLNAPLTSAPIAGAVIGPTVTYGLATVLPSVSIFDYWSPVTAVHRLLAGAAVDKLSLHINGDFHEFQFSGVAQDLIDSTSFSSGLGQLTTFPPEPSSGNFDYTIVPGNLGQAWMGTTANRFYTITNASVQLSNNLDLRDREFGSTLSRAISPGRRTVTVDLDVYEQDNNPTVELYQAARQQSPISISFQLGQSAGQLFGVSMNSVVPEVPEFEDTERRLQWRFKNSRSQGTANDEIVVAFG